MHRANIKLKPHDTVLVSLVYALSFEKVQGAHCFGLVRPFVCLSAVCASVQKNVSILNFHKWLTEDDR